jgi:hypothetical protein
MISNDDENESDDEDESDKKGKPKVLSTADGGFVAAPGVPGEQPECKQS